MLPLLLLTNPAAGCVMPLYGVYRRSMKTAVYEPVSIDRAVGNGMIFHGKFKRARSSTEQAQNLECGRSKFPEKIQKIQTQPAKGRAQ